MILYKANILKKGGTKMPGPYDIESLFSTEPLRKHLQEGVEQLRELFGSGESVEEEMPDFGEENFGEE